MPQTGVTTLKPASLDELQRYLLANSADVGLFKVRGPFEVTIKEDLELQVAANERYQLDAYLSAPAEKAPLVILLHGHENSKEDHAYQALHLATWGMHSVSVQLPNTGPWIKNGELLARIVRFIHNHPTVKMLALAFVLLIGFALVAEGFSFHIPKGYIYVAMTFSVMVEALNVTVERRKRRARGGGGPK